MIKVISTKADLIEERKKDHLVGLVPTMGNLHAGHISLLEKALEEFSCVYFTIFVNPRQFGPKEDFNQYPRTPDKDLLLIEECCKKFPESKVVVFIPRGPEEVFPHQNDLTFSVLKLNSILEGEIRPGHFDGVSTVVFRLFELIKPNKAYFGLKDYQQYLVIKQMVKDLSLPLTIQGMPIIREKTGLAMSSRNQYLNSEQKEKSLILYKTLTEVVKVLDHQRANLLKAQDFIDKILTDRNWNYLVLRDSETLSENLINSKNITILGVYQLGNTRLLDNMQVDIK